MLTSSHGTSSEADMHCFCYSSKPVWQPYINLNGWALEVSISYSQQLWPWSGWVSVALSVSPLATQFKGEAAGQISLTISSPASSSSREPQQSTVYLPIRVLVVPPPPRSQRLIWDQFHNLRYPPGYFPRDNLHMRSDPLDWNADHIHTNFKDLYAHLRSRGYFVDILGR